jgi:hypothetical protein
MDDYFYLEEQLPDKPQLFRLGYLADFLLKMNKVSLPIIHYKENWQYLLPIIEFELSGKH